MCEEDTPMRKKVRMPAIRKEKTDGWVSTHPTKHDALHPHRDEFRLRRIVRARERIVALAIGLTALDVGVIPARVAHATALSRAVL